MGSRVLADQMLNFTLFFIVILSEEVTDLQMIGEYLPTSVTTHSVGGISYE
jgi:hypothetical protein